MTDKLKDQTSGMPAATDDGKRLTVKKTSGKTQVIINPPEKVQRDANESFRQALEKHTVMLEKKIELVIQGKAKRSELPEETLRQVFIRGYKSLPLNTELTREQYAMNRVNSFMAGGAAMKEDFDLIPVMERLGMKGTGGARRPHIKREKSPYNGKTIFHVVDAKGRVKHSTGDEGEAKQHLATKYNSYMESTLSPMKRFEGTKSLVKTYKDDTPGEKLKEGKMSDLDIDLKDMKDKDFETHYGKPKAEYTPKKKPAPVKKPANVKEAKDPREYGYEGDMAMSQLKSISRNADMLCDMMKPETDLPEWVQSKITLAHDYIQTAHDYMMTEMNEEVATDKQVRMAVGVANDKRYAGGNMTGAVKVMDKIKKGLANHPKVQGALKKANEQLEPIEELKSSTLTSYIDKVATGPSRGKTQSGLLKSIKAISGVTKAIRKRAENSMKEETLNELSPGKLRSYMSAGHKKYGEIEHKTDASSSTKKAKLVTGIKKAYGKAYPKPKPESAPKRDSSPGGYYASKKPGEYTGD